MRTEEVECLIEAGLPGSRVHAADLTGGGDHFAVEVTLEAFSGKSTVQRHKMIYATVGPQIADGSIHALSIRARTPSEEQVRTSP